jgi:glutamate-5-semialdehyde dehydrogenase
MSLQDEIIALAVAARQAARHLVTMTGAARNAALYALADALDAQRAVVMQANAEDLAQAQRDGLAGPMLARLTLTEKKYAQMTEGVRAVAAQTDPVGETLAGYNRPNGLRIEKRRVPLGVVGIIFESRPNVTIDAAALCLKSGNACLLRGGKESIRTNAALAQIIAQALPQAGVPAAAVQVITTTDRAAVTAMATATGYIDLLIPRGGEGLIRAVTASATVPVIKHYRGVCHVYVDAGADLAMAERIAVSAKADGVSLCNTAECLLVHESVAATFLPRVAALLAARNVELRCDARALKYLPTATPAVDSDWGAEFLDYIYAVKVVTSVADAITHINTYSSQHTDAIITQDLVAAERFTTEVDSASVMVNTSTRFADGQEYGLGAEIGISTDKLHSRGPMGAADLCTYKWIVTGSGQIRV